MSSPASTITEQGRKRSRSETQRVEPINDINEFNRDHQHPGSNLTLISSDGLQFRLHRLQIMAASNMMETEENSEDRERIFFADDEIEAAVCISSLLDLIYGTEAISSSSLKKLALPRTVQLMRKYECAALLTTLRFLVRSETATDPAKVFTRAYFLASAYMDDVRGAAEAVKRGDGDLFTPMNGAKKATEARTKDDIVWMGALNPDAMGEESLAEIPTRYLVGLIRSRRLIDNEKITRLGWRKVFEEVAREFVVILGRGIDQANIPTPQGDPSSQETVA